jgi:hypothetical protein
MGKCEISTSYTQIGSESKSGRRITKKSLKRLEKEGGKNG